MLRFLTGLPPGKVRFTIIDPVGLGENFAAFMHLADYDEKLVTAASGPSRPHIEQRLADLTEHMENVIQKYLRNQFETIEEYNVPPARWPSRTACWSSPTSRPNFTPDAARRLVSIATSGPSCGVCTLVSVGHAAPAMPRDFQHRRPRSRQRQRSPGRTAQFRCRRTRRSAAFPLALDAPARRRRRSPQIVQRVGKASRDAGARRGAVRVHRAAAGDGAGPATPASGIDVPLGRAGATRRQSFSLGQGTAQHVLIAGKTGSGKSTLLHALITNLALLYSPDEVELYLIDFKKGVEFKIYATHRLAARPGRRDRERARVRPERAAAARRRAEASAATCSATPACRTSPATATPRPDASRCRASCSIVDEFQEFFVEDDKLAQEASLLLDRLVRQGRAFGIHVLLGSQTLGGAYSLARSTLDQMAVRIALQCSEADAHLILSEDNTAARLLSRPGEAIYNDANGLVEGNNLFQVVWLSDEKREQVLDDLHEARRRTAGPPPLVFEGNRRPTCANNQPLAKQTRGASVPPKAAGRVAGRRGRDQGPDRRRLPRRRRRNLLMIGQNEDAARALVRVRRCVQPRRPSVTGPTGAGPCRSPSSTARRTTPTRPTTSAEVRPTRSGRDAPRCERGTRRPRSPSSPPRWTAGRRASRPTASPRFLFVFGVHRFRELRKADDDFGFGRRRREASRSPGERLRNAPARRPAAGHSRHRLVRLADQPEPRLRPAALARVRDAGPLPDERDRFEHADRLARGDEARPDRRSSCRKNRNAPEKFRPYGLPPAEWLDRGVRRSSARGSG